MPAIVPAIPTDRDALAAMMREFYAGEHLPFTNATLRALDLLLVSPTLGHAYLIHDAPLVPAGYFLLTNGFSLERGGAFTLLDELFILPAYRKKGLASVALQFAFAQTQQTGSKAILLEVDHANAPALSLYRRAGFKMFSRHFMARRLSDSGSP